MNITLLTLEDMTHDSHLLNITQVDALNEQSNPPNTIIAPSSDHTACHHSPNVYTTSNALSVDPITHHPTAAF